MLPISCTRVWNAFTMTSPYFIQSNSIVTRKGNQTLHRTGLAALKSKTPRKPRDVEAGSSIAVKLEEEEASISNPRSSTVPLLTGSYQIVANTYR